MKDCNECSNKCGSICKFHNRPIKEVKTVLAGLDADCKSIEFMDA